MISTDEMFDQITSKLTTDLEKHSEKLDRLDSKSRQFDRHMDDLRKANKRQIEGSEKTLAVVLRSDSTNPDLDPTKGLPGFGMGTPKYVKAPGLEDGVLNNSFVGSVDPYSNQLMEVDGGMAPPPPPSEAPPAHILEAAKKRGGGAPLTASGKPEEGYDEFGRLLDEDGNPYEFSDEEEDGGEFFDGEGGGEEEPGLSLDVTAEMDAAAKKELSDVQAGLKDVTFEEEWKKESSDSGGLPPSPNGVDWCEIMHPQHGRHYYMHHTGVSQWEKPKEGIVQCTDDGSQRIYYVNMVTNQSSWTAPGTT